MRLENFTVKAQEALRSAQELAETHPRLEDLHLLQALLMQEEGLCRPILAKAGTALPPLMADLRRELSKRPRVEGASPDLDPGAVQALEEARRAMERMGDGFVSTEHLLLALLETPGTSPLLKRAGLSEPSLRRALEEIRGPHKVTDPNPEARYQALQKYARDLTDLARQGRLDPVIGRDGEIRRVMQVLSRRTKNNPVLIGEPGVGKTAIAEALAQRIVEGDLPESLRGKRLMALDMGDLIAGTKFRGEFEDRLKALLREIADTAGGIILFIDEIHTLVGAGGAEGAVDAANLLKPALARGELRCIGATTLDEYKKHIEKDSALERRFQPVMVAEPDLEDSIAILRGLKERYEVHHGVRITDAAILAAARLSNRYIADRFLPDKAIDLIDEAASGIRMEIDSMPVELDRVERRIRQLEIERRALSKEKDPAGREGLEKLDRDLAEEREKATGLRARWEAEKKVIEGIKRARAGIESLKTEASGEERKGNLERVAEIRYGEIPGLEKELRELTEKLKVLQKDRALLKEEVGEEDVAGIVSKWTGIPVTRLAEGEKRELLEMEEALSRRVIGQEEALKAVSEAIRRSRAGLQDPDRPVGSFLFLGPTGVGKTELARTLADFLFHDESAMVRIDMSEYQEKHSVARLIGAPPGYVGFEEGGQLTEAVRRRPYSVLLLDEVEKAHPEVMNLLLQLLDEGRLTDGKGRTVDFKNVILIMTSNLGSELLLEMDPDEGGLEEKITALLKAGFRPEFLNRIDETVLFHRLAPRHLEKIVGIQIDRLRPLLAQKGLELQTTKKADAWLAKQGNDPALGARPLKRLLQKEVQNHLARMLLSSELPEGSGILVDEREGRLRFEVREPHMEKLTG